MVVVAFGALVACAAFAMATDTVQLGDWGEVAGAAFGVEAGE